MTTQPRTPTHDSSHGTPPVVSSLDVGPLPATPGPSAPESVLSDRAGDALGVRDPSGPAPADPINHAISTLDAISGDAWHGLDDGRSRRREILDAAGDLFAVRGYRGTSLRDISGRVGISHPGMLHHFKSKEALLDAVIDDLEAHAQHLIDHIQSFDTSVANLEHHVLRNFAADAHRMILFSVLATEAVDPDFPGHMRLIRLRRVYEHIAERVLRGFEARGLLVEGLDVPWAARLFVTYSLGLASREATIGAVQPSSAGLAGPDYSALIRLLSR